MSPGGVSSPRNDDPDDLPRPADFNEVDPTNSEMNRRSPSGSPKPLLYRSTTTTPKPSSTTVVPPPDTRILPSAPRPGLIVPFPIIPRNYSLSISLESSWCMRLSHLRLCVSDDQRSCTFLPYGGPKPEYANTRSLDIRDVNLAPRDQSQFERVC